jgi:hypothetical protein
MPPSVAASTTEPSIKYYAVRKCDSLDAPAVFLSWKDCSFYFDDESPQEVEYEIFKDLAGAFQYITGYIVHKKKKRSAPEDDDIAIDIDSKPAAKKVRTTAGRTLPNPNGPQTEEEWEDNFTQLKEYKDKFNTTRVSAKVDGVMTYRSLRRWTQTMRDELKKENSYLTFSQRLKLAELGLKDHARNSKEETQWEELFLQLKAFKAEHGHAQVPNKPYNSLRCWVVRQRKLYADSKEGIETALNSQRFALLTEVGFSFVPQRARKSTDARIDDWIAYMKKHGRVPPRHSPLNLWTTCMRKKYELFHDGDKTNLTQAQIDKLTEHHFKWDSMVAKPEKRATSMPWEDRLAQLVEYKRVHGHTNVTRSVPELRWWVYRQRNEYRYMLRGKKSQMTPERIEKLNRIGFGLGPATPRSKSIRTAKSESSDDDSDSDDER